MAYYFEFGNSEEDSKVSVDSVLSPLPPKGALINFHVHKRPLEVWDLGAGDVFLVDSIRSGEAPVL